MRLYNSLSRKIEDFQPFGDNITIYSCGPTVYERAHIGNLASFIYADTLHLALKQAYPHKQIKHVMNITDVDDKTIAASRQRYPDLEPNEALNKLTTEYENIFMDDIRAVGVDTDSFTFVRATKNIEPMQDLIKRLVRAGFAYISDDGIYFNTLKYSNEGIEDRGGVPRYGILSPTAIQGLVTESQRTDHDEYDKHEAIDFALWKRQKPDEPAWDFEIAGKNLKGRPGWHIECSAMSVKELGQPFDIHTGGVDLKFPHHENEIAQSTAIDGKLLARYFFHNEHMLVEGKKMSKSLSNFYTLEDIKQKNIDPLAFRLLVLQAHYRTQAHFSWDNLQAAQNRLKELGSFADTKHQINAETHIVNEQQDQTYEGMISGLLREMEDDLDTPSALGFLSSYISHVESMGRVKQHFQNLLDGVDNIFGLSLSARQDITYEQKMVIEEREQARKAQDWAESDELRDRLKEQGIEINDTPSGPIWSRVN